MLWNIGSVMEVPEHDYPIRYRTMINGLGIPSKPLLNLLSN